MSEQKYIPIRESQINYYKDFPLFYRTGENQFVLYKRPGVALKTFRLEDEKHPDLYIDHENRIKTIEVLQKEFNKHLKKNISSGNIGEVKKTICSLVEETLSEPRSGTLQAMPETIDIMISGYSEQPHLLKTFASISYKDYTTAIHSVNVMALTIGFCFFYGYSSEETKRLGLSALLHDVGKTEIDTKILNSQQRLTEKEFDIMKSHTRLGANIIRKTPGISKSIITGANEHHEKLDGSGYPLGITDISHDGQILGLIDCYEALTNEDRLYRRAKMPYDTLQLLKEEVNTGKFSRKYFEKLCASLV